MELVVKIVTCSIGMQLLLLTLFIRSTGSRDRSKIPTVHRYEHGHIFVFFSYLEIYYKMRIFLFPVLEILVKVNE